jgi:predicted nucleic acid-binding protein
MNLAMDTDALIKLTKSSAKQAVGTAFTVLVPGEVQRECVQQGKAGGFPDALRVEENIERGVLTVRKPKRSKRTEAIVRDLRLSGGEADVLRLHRSGGIDLVVSDDRRFLQILEALGIRYTTPGPLIAALSRMGRVPREEALEHLEKLAGFISEEEWSEARHAIEEG